MAALFSTTSGVAVIDTRIRPGTITLPLTTQIPSRYLQIKDLYGSFGASSLTLNTQAGETFDDRTTSKILRDPFSFMTLYAASTGRWAVLGATQTIQQTVSSLIVSSINTNTLLATSLRVNTISSGNTIVSSVNLVDPFLGTPNFLTVSSGSLLLNNALISGGGITTLNLTSTVTGLGTIGYVSTVSLYSTITRWSQYPTTSDITLSNSTGIVPANTNDPIRLKTNILEVQDVNGGWGTLNIGPFINMATSSSSETYIMGFNPILTGSISSFGFSRGDGLGFTTASLYISSLFFGNFGGTVTGELTTDGTATDLFWKGSKLNDQGGGGGGITAEQLTSTATRWATYPAVSSIVFANDTSFTQNEIVSPGNTFFTLVNEIGVIATSSNINGIYPTRGFLGRSFDILDQLDTLNPGNNNYYYSINAGQGYTGFISSIVMLDFLGDPGPLYLSSLYFGNKGGTVTGQLTTDSTASNLFWNGSQLMTNRVKLVVSTLGSNTMYINESDIAIQFIVNGSNCPQDIVLPDITAAGDGWNVKIQNPGSNLGVPLAVYDFNSNVLFTINSAQMYSVVTDGSTWYYTYSYEF